MPGIANDKRVARRGAGQDRLPSAKDRGAGGLGIKQHRHITAQAFQRIGDIAGIIDRAVQVADEGVVVDADHQAMQPLGPGAGPADQQREASPDQRRQPPHSTEKATRRARR